MYKTIGVIYKWNVKFNNILNRNIKEKMLILGGLRPMKIVRKIYNFNL